MNDRFNRHPQRGRGQRGFGGGRPGRSFSHNQRKSSSFNPSMFIKKAVEEVEEVYQPQHAFSDFPLNEQLYKNIVARGYTAPTPIQDQAIPYLLEGRDMIGLANTGTGKTAAFLIPLINKIMNDRTQKVLIVAPTRELAVQIEQEFRQFSQGMNLHSALCIGGVNIYGQIMKLRKKPHVVIGTPGRLKDLEYQRVLNFNWYTNIVLDEVDRMFDMGFIREVKHIIAALPPERQSLFFSATLTDELQSVMHQFLNDPVKISVKSRESAANVDQDIVKLNGKSRVDVLHELLSKEEFAKVIVFSRTKRGTEKLSMTLEQRGFSVGALHGNKTQNQRQRAIEMFKRDHIQVLVATDVASRGLDIDNVTHVINYDLPESYEDYIHRIGRTGRANKKGVALTLID